MQGYGKGRQRVTDKKKTTLIYEHSIKAVTDVYTESRRGTA